MFDWQPAEAVRLWEKSAALDPGFPIVHRNLAIAYSRQDNALAKAIASLEKAVGLDGKHALHLFELDQLYEAAGVAPEKRLAMFEKHFALARERDDALARAISLKVNLGKYGEAIELMRGRRFNVWEGGVRFSVHDTWTDAHLLRGHSLRTSDPKRALADYRAALEFPDNLQVARFRSGGRHAEVSYWIGVALEVAGDTAGAREAWREAAAEIPRVGGDDILPTTDRTVLLYYQAMALARLGEKERAARLFAELVKSGESALRRQPKVDVFAKFGDRQSQRARLAQAHYIAGLGYAGLQEFAKARAQFRSALAESPDHLGAKTALSWLP